MDVVGVVEKAEDIVDIEELRLKENDAEHWRQSELSTLIDSTDKIA